MRSVKLAAAQEQDLFELFFDLACARPIRSVLSPSRNSLAPVLGRTISGTIFHEMWKCGTFL